MWTNTEEFHNNKDTEDCDDNDDSVIFGGNYIKIREAVSDIQVGPSQIVTYKVDNCSGPRESSWPSDAWLDLHH